MTANTGLVHEERLLFERSVSGRRGYKLPSLDVPEISSITGVKARSSDPRLPELSEPDVIRHYTRLSQWNYSIDAGFYPLGSCTMKFNPRVNEDTASLAGFANLHPQQTGSTIQGALEAMALLENILAEITGLSAVTLQPAAGAHGEFTGVLCIRAALEAKGEHRTKILVPESAHGTNPASASVCGFTTVEVPAGPDGIMHVEQVRELMDETVAGLMVTHPNTLGLYEANLKEICQVVHEKGGYVYGDGANLNALMGIVKPGEIGIDVMHLNLHKTFSTPHGGGGPGAGPVAVTCELAPFLPRPVIKRENGRFEWLFDAPQSLGKIRAFYGNFGVLIRALTYVLELGGEGLAKASRLAILNANYLRVNLGKTWHVAFDKPSMHEVILTDQHIRENGVVTMDVAKRLIDYGFHPPTVYFPLVVPHAIMIEPTETESLDELDAFIAAMEAISQEAREQPEVLHNAPTRPFRRRLDEVLAAKKPVLKYDFA